MSDFTIIDIQSDKRITADDGDEVTLYVRPGGTKAAVIRRAGDWGDPDHGIDQWEARWESGAPISSSFTVVQVSTETELVGGTGPGTETVPSAAAIMIDTTIPPGFIGINRCSVFCHVGSTTTKAVTVKFVILPYDKWYDASWLPQNLVDIVWELHSDNAWSEGLAERWALNANAQTSYISLRAGADVPFAVIPMIAGVPLTGATDVTALSFALRAADDYVSDPLVTVAAAAVAGYILTTGTGSNLYYALTATLTGDNIVAAFAILNARVTVDPANPVDKSKLAVFGQFTLTTGGKTYTTRAIPFFLEQPAAALA